VRRFLAGLLFSAVAIGAQGAIEQEATIDQTSAEINDGMKAFNTKLSFGGAAQNPDKYSTTLFTGNMEFMATDFFGIRGMAGIPISTAINDLKYWSLSGGFAAHFLPRTWFDPFIAADISLVHINVPGFSPQWTSALTPVAGFTLYYFGMLFLEAEAGYTFLRYAGGASVDLSAFTYRIRGGLYF
jgi:hypothetical protein